MLNLLIIDQIITWYDKITIFDPRSKDHVKMTLYLLMISGHTALYKLQWMLHFRGSCILRLFNTDNGVKKLWTEVIFQYYLIPLSEGQFNKTVTSVAIVWESKTKATLVNYTCQSFNKFRFLKNVFRPRFYNKLKSVLG